ncbi:hypothetical protein NP493_910g01056 [Ridgeia piscesae]|uniref:Uncharacterized protein n=1 Tax=Ridgeia piscesae TaxID=27915 RepID=A0AAD9KKT7_RIDPI|nr:hypothetical protein NP493_910g01056 [Ridgeia piscesae]
MSSFDMPYASNRPPAPDAALTSRLMSATRSLGDLVLPPSRALNCCMSTSKCVLTLPRLKRFTRHPCKSFSKRPSFRVFVICSTR